MTPRTKTRSKSERLAYDRMLKNLRAFQNENDLDYALREHIPIAWAALEDDIDVAEPKVKLTLMLDKSVASFYRALGQGYQARMNRILSTFAQMKIAQIESLWDRIYEESPYTLFDEDRARREKAERKGQA